MTSQEEISCGIFEMQQLDVQETFDSPLGKVEWLKGRAPAQTLRLFVTEICVRRGTEKLAALPNHLAIRKPLNVGGLGFMSLSCVFR